MALATSDSIFRQLAGDSISEVVSTHPAGDLKMKKQAVHLQILCLGEPNSTRNVHDFKENANTPIAHSVDISNTNRRTQLRTICSSSSICSLYVVQSMIKANPQRAFSLQAGKQPEAGLRSLMRELVLGFDTIDQAASSDISTTSLIVT